MLYGAGLLLTLLSSSISLTSAQQICNNSPDLCSKTYNNITHLGAHDSPFVRNVSNGFTPAGDQFYNSTTQLDSGVRLLSGQIHKVTANGGAAEYHLCHTNCDLYDAGSLSDWLNSLNSWLDSNPNDVITILLVNSDNADAPTLGSIFSGSEMDQKAYKPNDTTQATSDWPTLGEMIQQNKRLVAFVASLDPAKNQVAPYLLDEFTFMFENPYDYDDPSTFSCDPDRPDTFGRNPTAALASKRLPFMNHFLYDKVLGVEVPSVENVEKTDSPDTSIPSSLATSAANCTNVYNTPPKFFLVDFANVGPALATVDRINGVAGSISGRKMLPTTVQGSMDNPIVSNAPVSVALGVGSSAVAGAQSVLTSATAPMPSAASSTAASDVSAVKLATSDAASGAKSIFGKIGRRRRSLHK